MSHKHPSSLMTNRQLITMQHIRLSSLFRLWLSRLVRVLLGKTVTDHLNKLLANSVCQSLTSGCSHVTQLCISSVLDARSLTCEPNLTGKLNSVHGRVSLLSSWSTDGNDCQSLCLILWYGWGWVGSFLLPYHSTVLYLIVTFQFLCVILVLQLRSSNHGTMY